MLTTDFHINTRVLEAARTVTVFPGGLTATSAGEVYEADSPAALASQLAPALYQTMHTGRDKPMELAVRSFRTPRFESRLIANVPALQRHVPGTLLPGSDPTSLDDRALVDMAGLRVRVPKELISQPTTSIPQYAEGEPVLVSVPCMRPGLSPGFLYMMGRKAEPAGPTLRIYAGIPTAEQAPQVWCTAVETLDSLNINWHAKVLSAPFMYPRTDALVIYLQRDGWRHVRHIAQTLQATDILSPVGSPFVKPVTESVGVAFDPADDRPSHTGLSFGQHRTTVLAQALVEQASTPDTGLDEAIFSAFIDANIDPAEPARNLTSPMTDVLGM